MKKFQRMIIQTIVWTDVVEAETSEEAQAQAAQVPELAVTHSQGSTTHFVAKSTAIDVLMEER